jgi:hypothetical protein
MWMRPTSFSQGDFAALYVCKPFAWKMSQGCDTDVRDMLRTSADVRFGSKADIATGQLNVRFTPASSTDRRNTF